MGFWIISTMLLSVFKSGNDIYITGNKQYNGLTEKMVQITYLNAS